MLVAGVEGIGPPSALLERAVLPLNDTPSLDLRKHYIWLLVRRQSITKNADCTSNYVAYIIKGYDT